MKSEPDLVNQKPGAIAAKNVACANMQAKVANRKSFYNT